MRFLPLLGAVLLAAAPAGAFACSTLVVSGPLGSATTPVVQAGQTLSLRGTTTTTLSSIDVLIGGRLAASFTAANGLASTASSWSLAIDKPLLQRGTNAVTVRSASGCTASNTTYISTARLAFTPPAGVPRSPLARFVTDYATVSDAFPIYLSYPGIDHTTLTVAATNMATTARRTITLADTDTIWRGSGSELYFTLGRLIGGNSAGSMGDGVYRLEVTGSPVDGGSPLTASVFVNISSKLIRTMSVADATRNTYNAVLDLPLFSTTDRTGKAIWNYAKLGNADQAATAGWWKELSPQNRIELGGLVEGRVTVSLPPSAGGSQRVNVCLYTALGKSNCQQ